MLFASLAVTLVDRKDGQVGGRNSHERKCPQKFTDSSWSIVMKPH